MLVQQILDRRVPLEPRANPVRSADVDFLIAGVEIRIRQQQAVAEIDVGSDEDVLSSAWPAK
jgi:hypothetical protein